MSKHKYTTNQNLVYQKKYTMEELLLLKLPAFNMIVRWGDTNKYYHTLRDEKVLETVLKIMYNRHYAEPWFNAWMAILDLKYQDINLPIRIIAEKLELTPADVSNIMKKGVTMVAWIMKTSDRFNVKVTRNIMPESTVRELALNLLTSRTAIELMDRVGKDADITLLALSANFYKYFDKNYITAMERGTKTDSYYNAIIKKLEVIGCHPVKVKPSNYLSVEAAFDSDKKRAITKEITAIKLRLTELEKMIAEL